MDGLETIGRVRVLNSKETGSSVFGLGLEKLDRGLYDPENAYDRIAESGVRWIRIQSGWNRTEREAGLYDFAWLDRIVDQLRRRNLVPWLCLCYGNKIYDPKSAEIFGAVGCPPRTEEQKQAWLRYVRATVEHFKGRIDRYEIWNEPDGVWCWKCGVNGAEYGELLKMSARVIREADPAAKVIGGAICRFDLQWLQEMLKTGAGKAMDLLSYHGYNPDETVTIRVMRAVKALCHMYNPELKFVEGENGAQSRRSRAGALWGAAWTPRRQAKALARMMLLHLMEGVEICSYCSCLDMAEALNGTTEDRKTYRDYAYFGVLAATFTPDGIATGAYTPKPAFRTLQVLASIFQGEYRMQTLPILMDPHCLNGFPQTEPSWRIRRTDDSAREIISQGFVKPGCGYGFVYWVPKEVLTTEYESTITLECCGLTGEIHLVDLLDGTVYALPEEMVETDGSGWYRLKHIPVRDSPLLLAFGDFVEMA